MPTKRPEPREYLQWYQHYGTGFRMSMWRQETDGVVEDRAGRHVGVSCVDSTRDGRRNRYAGMRKERRRGGVEERKGDVRYDIRTANENNSRSLGFLGGSSMSNGESRRGASRE